MIPVIYRCDHFLVIDKPPGLGMHSEIEAGLVVQLQKQLQVDQLYPVHRLDKMTSGLLVFALNKPTAQAFQALFAQHKMQKFYLAISDHKPKKKQGWVKGDMQPARRGSWKLSKTLQNPAVTRFISTPLNPGERLFLLMPLTGKTHQLRVALKSLAAPICGDARYAQADEAKQEDRGYLHAYALQFSLFGQDYEFVCPPSVGERFLTAVCQTAIATWSQPWNQFR